MNSDLYWLACDSCWAFSSTPRRAASISMFLISMLRFCSGQLLGLLLQLRVGPLQLGRLVLQLRGEALALHQQLLGAPVGLDGGDGDADGGHEPREERQVQRGERGDRAQLDDAQALPLEQHRQHDDGLGRRGAGARADRQVALGHVAHVQHPPARARPARRGRRPPERDGRLADGLRVAAHHDEPAVRAPRGRTRPTWASTSGDTSFMIIWQTSTRSRWPCSSSPIRARLESSQFCWAFSAVVSRSVAIIWLMLSLRSATSPAAATRICWVRSPLATDVDTPEIARSCEVRVRRAG